MKVSRALLSLLLFVSSTPTAFRDLHAAPSFTGSPEDHAEIASITERKIDFYNFDFKTVDGRAFDLRDYSKGKSVVIIEYFAGWCPNSNRNGHVIEKVWTSYRDRGLGVVGVAEYSDNDELRIHINRIGIDYPLVVDTKDRTHRKNSSHYKYRHLVGDKRKWGTPFYLIIDTQDIEPASPTGMFARRVYTVSGEVDESELVRFIQPRLKIASSY